MPSLLMLPPAPVIERPNGAVRLDVKFLEGMRLHASLWQDRFDCILRRGADAIPFGVDVNRGELSYDVATLDPLETLAAGRLAGYDLVVASGDLHSELHLADPPRDAATKLVYVVEYTIATRLRVVLLDRGRSLPRKLRSLAWNLAQELRRRRAFRRADGLQVNGYPAYEAYRRLNPNTLLYLDGRMTPALLATETEMRARAARLLSGAPLRLFHSGRLEPMKGAQDLIPVARSLAQAGLDFTLDIYGAGSLREQIRAGVRDGLADRVTLHDPVDFETELVPVARARGDVFLSCHRQADPSCTYLESMGCGLAVVGYDNAMWSALARASGAGWTAPMGDASALARRILALDADRPAVVAACAAGLAFASRHDFLSESRRRIDHLRATLSARNLAAS